MRCPNCETENRDDAKFCDECGFPLSGAMARAAGAPAPAPASSQREWRSYDDAIEPEPLVASGEADIEMGVRASTSPAEGLKAAEDGFDPTAPTRREPDAGETRPFNVVDGFGFASPIGDEWPHGEEQPVEGAPAPDASWQSDFTMEMPRLEDASPHAARDFRVDAGKPKRSRGKLAAFIVAGVVFGLVAAVLVVYALGFWGGVAVPDVRGMTEADARNVLSGEGFEVRSTQVKSDDTEGLVLITDPEAGSRAPEGSEVVVHVSTARFIPDMVGASEDEARALLADAGYDNVRIEKRKSDGAEGIVIAVEPEEGTRAKSNTEVVVTVSEAYRVPQIDGLDEAAASNAVSEAGLTPQVVYLDTDQFPDGTVIGANPEQGAKVSEGAVVTISVARARGVELENLTEGLFATGNTVTVGGVDYEIESVVSITYQGDDTVAFTATGRPKITFFGETLYASSSQTISGVVAWSDDNEVVGIY